MVAGPPQLAQADVVRMQVGLNILLMSTYGTQPHFLERRTEVVSFVDSTTASRRVEVHLNLSGLVDPEKFPLLNGEILVPIAAVRRFDDEGVARHTAFDVFDERSARLPRLTRYEERELVFFGLVGLAQRVLEHPPSSAAVQVMWSVINGDDGISTLYGNLDDDVQHLVANREFVGFLSEASQNFYLICPLRVPPYRRRVVTYSYGEQPVFDSGLAGKALKRLVSPQPGVSVTCEAPMAAFASSYHFRMEAPTDVIIPKGCAGFVVRRAFAPLPDDPVVDDDRSDQSAHVFYEGSGPIRRATFTARLLPAETGVVWALRACTLAASLLTFLATWAVWCWSRSTLNAIDRSSLTTSMLLVPAVITTGLAIRSRHGLISRMSYGMKATAAAPTLCLFVGTLCSTIKPINIAVARVSWSFGAAVALLAIVRVMNEVRWLASARKVPTWQP